MKRAPLPKSAEKADKLPAVEEIADFLALRIRNGEFAAGARLPTEFDLAQRFAVSRPVVREAISRVKAEGLVQSRRGSGLYVASIFDRQSFKVDVALGGEGAAVAKLFELRIPIEIAAARLAAARHTEEDIARIEACHKQLLACGDREHDAQDTADLNFHLAIARATQNNHFGDLMAYLGTVIYKAIRFARSSSGPRVRRMTIGEHTNILNAIRNRDPEAASQAVVDHLNGALQRMTKGLVQRQD